MKEAIDSGIRHMKPNTEEGLIIPIKETEQINAFEKSSHQRNVEIKS